ncbi:unnamed protein product [Pleuronectes platessa]|uniref:Uncharacterized protein n=1 Tax=Pleuronectes platessa TaxID=8262 RepID=A0A9N7UCE7_PLEPL|nr:unnamed protein product [Pleuronectes platessa]
MEDCDGGSQCWDAWPPPAWLSGAVPGDDRQWSTNMLSMDGLEMIAVLVVMALFIKVLEQFGMFEPVGGEGLNEDRHTGAVASDGRSDNNELRKLKPPSAGEIVKQYTVDALELQEEGKGRTDVSI